MNLEFVDETPVDEPSDDELLDVGTARRVPRWLVGALLAAAMAFAAFVIVNRAGPAAAPPAGSSRPTPVRPAAAPVAALDPTFTTIYQTASDAAPAHDIRRTGTDATSCKSARVGTAPQRDAGAVLTHDLRGYTVQDTARIIDEGAGLCALQIRAHDPSGTVAVIMVTSPMAGRGLPQREALETRSAPFDGLILEYARLTTPDGWTIVVGTSGPAGKQPAAGQLADLALSPALRW